MNDSPCTYGRAQFSIQSNALEYNPSPNTNYLWLGIAHNKSLPTIVTKLKITGHKDKIFSLSCLNTSTLMYFIVLYIEFFYKK